MEEPKGDLRIYALVTRGQHGDEGDQDVLAAYKLRKDGFVCLSPEGKWGELITRAIVPQDEVVAINARAPRGQVIVEVLDAEEKPLAEYSGKNAARFTGDERMWKARWPKGNLGTKESFPVLLFPLSLDIFSSLPLPE